MIESIARIFEDFAVEVMSQSMAQTFGKRINEYFYGYSGDV